MQHHFSHGHFKLVRANLYDQTDTHSELLQEDEWLLHPAAGDMRLRGNAFALEDTLDGSGRVFLKLAPLPDSRAVQSAWDVCADRDGTFELNTGDGYSWRDCAYENGKWGRIAAAHSIQRDIRPYDRDHDGLFLTNTWGDRNRDGRLNSEFLIGETAAGARLGADVLQIDDGWQQGVTANSSLARGAGTWNGFWATDPHFWDINRQRFPDGLEHLCNEARARGLRIGLWFAPDSSDGAANWERDAGVLLGLHRSLGVEFFKIDAMKIGSPQSEDNFRKLFAKVLDESRGSIVLDLDITAERRLGYFGAVEAGLLFVENRYTDWHNYWPHQTLRTAWQLMHWIDPVRLRIEWLNNARNEQKYVDDPLAPSRYASDALFAITMFCSPLGWFENQNLPPSYFENAAPLIDTWKQHRQAMQNGTVLPVGDTPDGNAWTGFVSIAADHKSGYALLFRELNKEGSFTLKIPGLGNASGNTEILGGCGDANLSGGHLAVSIPKTLHYVWMRFAVAL